MTRKVNTLSALKSAVQKDIDEIISNELAPRVEKLVQHHIQTDVYDVYSPRMYNRRGTNGGLLDPDNIKSNVYNGLLEIYDDAVAFPYYYKRGKRKKSQNAGKPLSNVIETGIGYDITDWDYYGEPRPFMHNTYDDLVKWGLTRTIVRAGLRVKGYEVK